MNPIEFQRKWLANTQKERTASQSHFNDLCELVGHPKPLDLDPEGASEVELKTRTLTNLYNQRPTWLQHAHAALDRAVWAAYGWDDPDPAAVDEDMILARLLALNGRRRDGDGSRTPQDWAMLARGASRSTRTLGSACRTLTANHPVYVAAARLQDHCSHVYTCLMAQRRSSSTDDCPSRNTVYPQPTPRVPDQRHLQSHTKEHQLSKLSRRTLVLAASSVPAVAIAFGVRAAQDGMSTPDASPEASPMASPQASPMASPTGGGAVQLNAVDINWEPKELTIPADTDVPINVVNTGVLQHNFVIDELSIESDLLNGGESSDVVVNAPAGSYTFYCSVPGHKEAGMVGTLTVE